MSDVSIKYKGNEIATMNASGTKTLLTSGKYCEGDISVEYAKPVSYVKLAEKEFTLNVTSTSQANYGTIAITPASDVYTDDYYILVTIRDKAGKRAGYFLGSDSLYANFSAANGETTSLSAAARVIHSVDSNNKYYTVAGSYGLYATTITSAGVVTIAGRYHTTYSKTMNGTYKVEVWALQYAPNTNPFA